MTVLAIASNRYGPNSFLIAGATGVAADASLSEFFTLPPGYGDLLIKRAGVIISNFSGAYVAPAPAYDGVRFEIVDSSGSTTYDMLGASRFVHVGTVAARPVLSVVIEFDERCLMGRLDRLYIFAPVLAGAGVTADVSCRLTGVRINSA